MKKLKHIYRPVVAVLIKGLARLAQALPRRFALELGELMGAAVYRLKARDRRRALANLNAAFGGRRPRREIFRIARESFSMLGRSTMEILRLPRMTGEEIAALIDADSFEPVERVLARGKGILLLGAHLGAWEVFGAYAAIRLGRPFHAIGKRLYFEPYNDLLVDMRRSVGVETVYQDEGARPVLKVLRSGLPLAILADQDVGRLDGVFVDFFGRPAWTPTGPAALARASGAGLVPFLITWNGLRHHLHVLPEIEIVRTRDRRADAVENTQRWTKVVECIIRKYPEQWVWFHPRWRTRPPADEVDRAFHHGDA